MGYIGSTSKKRQQRTQTPLQAADIHAQHLSKMLIVALLLGSFNATSLNLPSVAADAPGASDSAGVEDPPARPGPPPDELGEQLEKKLEDLESHFFGHVYRAETAQKRIVRLERFVFGTESGGPYLTRINHIASTLSVTEPDGTKHEIALHPKETAPEPPGQPTQSPGQPPSMPNALSQSSSESSTTTGSGSSQIPNIVNSNSSSGTNSNASANPVAPASPNDDSIVRTPLEPSVPLLPVMTPPANAPQQIASVPVAPPAGQKPKLLVMQVSKGTFATTTNPNESIKELDQAIRVHPSDADLLYERAKAFIQLDKFSNALNDLSDAIMHDPNKSAYYIARAWTYKKLGNSYLAADDVKQARFVDPALPPQIDLLQNPKATPADPPAAAAE